MKTSADIIANQMADEINAGRRIDEQRNSEFVCGPHGEREVRIVLPLGIREHVRMSSGSVTATPSELRRLTQWINGVLDAQSL